MSNAATTDTPTIQVDLYLMAKKMSIPHKLYDDIHVAEEFGETRDRIDDALGDQDVSQEIMEKNISSDDILGAALRWRAFFINKPNNHSKLYPFLHTFESFASVEEIELELANEEEILRSGFTDEINNVAIVFRRALIKDNQDPDDGNLTLFSFKPELNNVFAHYEEYLASNAVIPGDIASAIRSIKEIPRDRIQQIERHAAIDKLVILRILPRLSDSIVDASITRFVASLEKSSVEEFMRETGVTRSGFVSYLRENIIDSLGKEGGLLYRASTDETAYSDMTRIEVMMDEYLEKISEDEYKKMKQFDEAIEQRQRNSIEDVTNQNEQAAKVLLFNEGIPDIYDDNTERKDQEGDIRYYEFTHTRVAYFMKKFLYSEWESIVADMQSEVANTSEKNEAKERAEKILGEIRTRFVQKKKSRLRDLTDVLVAIKNEIHRKIDEEIETLGDSDDDEKRKMKRGLREADMIIGRVQGLISDFDGFYTVQRILKTRRYHSAILTKAQRTVVEKKRAELADYYEKERGEYVKNRDKIFAAFFGSIYEDVQIVSDLREPMQSGTYLFLLHTGGDRVKNSIVKSAFSYKNLRAVLNTLTAPDELTHSSPYSNALTLYSHIWNKQDPTNNMKVQQGYEPPVDKLLAQGIPIRVVVPSRASGLSKHPVLKAIHTNTSEMTMATLDGCYMRSLSSGQINSAVDMLSDIGRWAARGLDLKTLVEIPWKHEGYYEMFFYKVVSGATAKFVPYSSVFKKNKKHAMPSTLSVVYENNLVRTYPIVRLSMRVDPSIFYDKIFEGDTLIVDLNQHFPSALAEDLRIIHQGDLDYANHRVIPEDVSISHDGKFVIHGASQQHQGTYLVYNSDKNYVLNVLVRNQNAERMGNRADDLVFFVRIVVKQVDAKCSDGYGEDDVEMSDASASMLPGDITKKATRYRPKRTQFPALLAPKDHGECRRRITKRLVDLVHMFQEQDAKNSKMHYTCYINRSVLEQMKRGEKTMSRELELHELSSESQNAMLLGAPNRFMAKLPVQPSKVREKLQSRVWLSRTVDGDGPCFLEPLDAFAGYLGKDRDTVASVLTMVKASCLMSPIVHFVRSVNADAKNILPETDDANAEIDLYSRTSYILPPSSMGLCPYYHPKRFADSGNRPSYLETREEESLKCLERIARTKRDIVRIMRANKSVFEISKVPENVQPTETKSAPDDLGELPKYFAGIAMRRWFKIADKGMFEGELERFMGVARTVMRLTRFILEEQNRFNELNGFDAKIMDNDTMDLVIYFVSPCNFLTIDYHENGIGRQTRVLDPVVSGPKRRIFMPYIDGPSSALYGEPRDNSLRTAKVCVGPLTLHAPEEVVKGMAMHIAMPIFLINTGVIAGVVREFSRYTVKHENSGKITEQSLFESIGKVHTLSEKKEMVSKLKKKGSPFEDTVRVIGFTTIEILVNQEKQVNKEGGGHS